MKMLDCLIINPSALDQIYQSLSREYAAIEPPIWGGLIAGHLQRKNFSVDILDCEAEGLTADQASQQALNYKAKIITIVVYGQQPSASTQNMFAASILARKIKELNPFQKILLIGGHCSALPKRTLLEESVDFVCQGEGPQTLVGLLMSNMDSKQDLERIPGLWYKDEGLAKFTTPSPVISQTQLNSELPGVAWDLLPMKKYRAHNWHCFDNINQRQPYASLYTSLGCPFSCTFCCINAPFGKSSFRYWDPQHIIKQFDLLVEKYQVKNIKIADEMFVLKESHFMELCKLLKERKYGLNMWAYSRIDTAKPQYMDALKSAGVNWIVLGIESKSQFVRDGVNKSRFVEDEIPTTVKMFQNSGIYVHANYIFGLPDDSISSMKETLAMAMELNCEMANFYCAMAYPGSELYNMAVANNWKLPETWIGYSQHAYETLPLPTKNLQAGEVLSFRDWAWQQYYTNPNYLEMIHKKFGAKTHQHMVQLTRTTLKRKYSSPFENKNY